MIKEYPTHDHLSAMSGITPEGKLYITVQESSYKGPDVVSFLRHLLRHIPGKLLVLWDRAPIHRSKVALCYPVSGTLAETRLPTERVVWPCPVRSSTCRMSPGLNIRLVPSPIPISI